VPSPLSLILRVLGYLKWRHNTLILESSSSKWRDHPTNPSIFMSFLFSFLPSPSFLLLLCSCHSLCSLHFQFGILVSFAVLLRFLFTFVVPLCFFFISSCCFDSIDNTWIFHTSLLFGASFGEFLKHRTLIQFY